MLKLNLRLTIETLALPCKAWLNNGLRTTLSGRVNPLRLCVIIRSVSTFEEL